MTCNRCNQTPCGCGPSPFYTQTPMCPEDNLCYVYNPSYSFSICPSVDWNIPAVGMSAILGVQGLKNAVVGSYIWNEAFGYYRIIAADMLAETITITNTGTPNNAEPGTRISPCTCFVVTDTPPNEPGVNCDAVAVDFTAPANGNCIDITLTSTEGLITGNNVQIGTGIYGLDEVKANNIITICNNGEGLPAGSPVIARDSPTSPFNYCVSLLTVNPCEAVAVARGNVVVCSEGNLTTLSGDQDGEILILLDHVAGTVGFGIPTPPTPEPNYATANVVGAAPVVGTIHNSNISSSTVTRATTNPSSVYTMQVFYTITGYFLGDLTDGLANNTSYLLYFFNLDLNTGFLIPQPGQTEATNYATDSIQEIGRYLSITGIAVIPPSGTYTLRANMEVAIGGATLDIDPLTIKIDTIALAVAT